MGRKKKEIKLKEPVRIREKRLNDCNISLYLDMYHKGARKKEGRPLIDRNPFKLLDAKEKPQKNSSIREFLTIEEVKQLRATPCRYDIVKRAFLFSCFTGLRYSDIKSLLWSEIRKAADGRTLFLEHPQVKTRKIVTVPLSEEALKWMPKQQKDKELVFHQLQITSTTVEVILGEWMKEAGIEKHITYHCSRHTTATLAITAGADISAVKEMLGHGSVTSTEVYAKVSLDKKIQAVNLTDGVFG